MKNLTLILGLFLTLGIFGQHNPVTFSTQVTNDTLQVHATIEAGWHLYAANLPNPNEGPLATEFKIISDLVNIEGVITETKGITEMDDAFGVEVIYFKDKATYYLPITTLELEDNYSAPLSISYMVCNDVTCIPFDIEVSVSF